MRVIPPFAVLIFYLAFGIAQANAASPISLPSVGDHELRILTPTLVELSRITTKLPDPAPITEWNFVGANFALSLPPASAFQVEVNGVLNPVTGVGFKRRPLYAPLKKRDLRIENFIYLKLANPIPEAATVRVRNEDGAFWNDAATPYVTMATSDRFNPAIHVNQTSYTPSGIKKGMVGYYLGSLGEMPVPATVFNIVNQASGEVAYTGQLTLRKDVGFSYSPLPYQQVYEADFTSLQAEGEFVLQVPGMGTSFPFLISQQSSAAFARTYALGLYHQRCGMKNELPHTRFEHGVCHAAPAEVPNMTFEAVNRVLAEVSYDYASNPLHTAPQLKDVNSSLYPFVNKSPVNVQGGHHDAGDYSKYTINSAGLIHHLVFAADNLASAFQLDNLGLPESSDGKSDLLQEAKWEADFLARMQDADGGFYFLVYPRNRRYEDNVLPDHGDTQIVFPKTTAATAAAVAALAEIASSPTFKTQFPAESAAYLAKARAGWNFLMTAIAIHGKNGSYQKITHYGNEFMHDDELAWAAAALFAATGEAEFHAKLKEWYDPSSPETRRWSWWRLFEGYGCAARAYAFAARSGRLAASTLDAAYLAKCAAEIKASGDDIARFAKQTAYGTSFPDPNKSFRTAGWYFSMERAFEAATAYQLNPDPQYMEAIHSNLAYEAGCNPVNVSYITGLGWKRWRDIVHQYAQNDHRVLPPSGIPLGNIQGGFAYLENYKQELGKLAYPPDGAVNATYPYYDRFGDSFNTTTEFVVVDQARALATTAFLLAQTGDYNSPSKSMIGSITGLPVSVPAETEVTATLQLAGINLSQARIVWEAADQEPFIGPAFKFAAKNPGSQWVEVEAQLPDGRRIYARTNFMASFSEVSAANSFQSAPLAVTPGVVALYHLDGNLLDVTGKNLPVTLSGQAQLDDLNLGWMSNRSGKALRFFDLGDKATVNIPGASLYTNGQIAEISLEAMIFINSYKAYNRAPARILSMQKTWNATLELMEDIYTGPHAKGGTQFDFFNSPLAAALPIKKWSRISLRINNSKYSLYIDGHLAASSPSTELAGWAYGVANLEVGNFDGWMDEITIRVSKPGSSTALNILPNIHFVSPQPGTTHQANDSMELEVATDDPDGTISKVEYFLESEKLCEQTLAPFRFIWTNVPAGQYSVQAVATDNSGGKSAPAFVSMTAVTPPIPPSPSHLFVKTLSRSSIQISWRDNSTNETGFRIYRSLDGSSFNEIVTLNANVILWKDYTVKPDTTYYYAVMAFNKAGESSEVVGSSVTFPYPPAAPVLTALTSTSSGIQVKWNPAATATSYKVKRSPTAAGPYTAVATSVSNTTFIDADVEPGVAYYYMVNAINIGGESPNSATGIVLAYVANSAQAAAPSLLFVKALSRSSIQVSWKDNSYNEDGFRIYRSLDGINFQEKAVVAPNVVIWKDYTVIPNTTYYYAVVAINEVGESAEIAGSATTLPFPPSIPANLTGIFQQGGINLAWSPVANALTYQVKRSSAVNGPWTTIATGVKSTSFKDTALTGGTTYYYSVSAVNTGGESANSLQVAITPPLAVVAFQEINTVLGGSWIGSKGSQGNIVISRTSTVPPYAAVTASGNSEWIWDYSTVDERALEVPLESTRIAACWFSQTSFDVMVNIQNSDEPKLISFYCLDWDNSRRSQTIQVIDPGLNTVLHTYQLSDFSNGVYVNYRLKGQVIFRLTRNAGPNAVLSGIYFDN